MPDKTTRYNVRRRAPAPKHRYPVRALAVALAFLFLAAALSFSLNNAAASNREDCIERGGKWVSHTGSDDEGFCYERITSVISDPENAGVGVSGTLAHPLGTDEWLFEGGVDVHTTTHVVDLDDPLRPSPEADANATVDGDVCSDVCVGGGAEGGAAALSGGTRGYKGHISIIRMAPPGGGGGSGGATSEAFIEPTGLESEILANSSADAGACPPPAPEGQVPPGVPAPIDGDAAPCARAEAENFNSSRSNGSQVAGAAGVGDEEDEDGTAGASVACTAGLEGGPSCTPSVAVPEPPPTGLPPP